MYIYRYFQGLFLQEKSLLNYSKKCNWHKKGRPNHLKIAPSSLLVFLNWKAPIGKSSAQFFAKSWAKTRVTAATSLINGLKLMPLYKTVPKSILLYWLSTKWRDCKMSILRYPKREFDITAIPLSILKKENGVTILKILEKSFSQLIKFPFWATAARIFNETLINYAHTLGPSLI